MDQKMMRRISVLIASTNNTICKTSQSTAIYLDDKTMVPFRFARCCCMAIALTAAGCYGFLVVRPPSTAAGTRVSSPSLLHLAKPAQQQTTPQSETQSARTPTMDEFHEQTAEAAHADLTSLNEPNNLTESTSISSTTHLASNNALDICQDLQGNTLTVEYLTAALNLPPEVKVTAYSCPESEAFRGFMSNGCRIYLHSSSLESKNNSYHTDHFPTTAFYKRVAFSSLDHAQEKLQKAPFKLLRDIRSYQVVAAFLNSQARTLLLNHTTGLFIPECYHAQLQPNLDHPMESQFTFLLQDFHETTAGWYQTWCLTDMDEVMASLHVYAQLHAYFWQGSDFYRLHPDASHELTHAVWESGSYVQPSAQPAEQVHQVAAEWHRKRPKFRKHLECYSFWDDLGTRLEHVASYVGRHAHPFATKDLDEEYHKYRTLTHGDPKQANLFFRKPSHAHQDTDNDRPVLDVGLVDFQWSGFGLAASDVAHFMASSVHADLLQQEDDILQYYYNQLQARLIQYGVYANQEQASREYSFETFLEQYETAILDLSRLVIAYTLERFTEAVDKSDSEEKKARTRNQTSYNKSIPNLVWLVTKCDAILKKRGI